MTVVIKHPSDKQTIEKKLEALKREKKFDAQKFCGVLKLKRSPLAIQLQLRDEWK